MPTYFQTDFFKGTDTRGFLRWNLKNILKN